MNRERFADLLFRALTSPTEDENVTDLLLSLKQEIVRGTMIERPHDKKPLLSETNIALDLRDGSTIELSVKKFPP